MAFVCSLYLRELKTLIEDTLTNTMTNREKSLLRRILIVRFLVNVYKVYFSEGFFAVLQRIFGYIFKLIWRKFDHESSTIFNDVPKLMTACGLYISLKYFGLPISLLIFAIFLLVDMVVKSIGWVTLKILNNTGMITQSNRLNRNESLKFKKIISS